MNIQFDPAGVYVVCDVCGNYLDCSGHVGFDGANYRGFCDGCDSEENYDSCETMAEFIARNINLPFIVCEGD